MTVVSHCKTSFMARILLSCLVSLGVVHNCTPDFITPFTNCLTCVFCFSFVELVIGGLSQCKIVTVTLLENGSFEVKYSGVHPDLHLPLDPAPGFIKLSLKNGRFFVGPPCIKHHRVPSFLDPSAIDPHPAFTTFKLKVGGQAHFNVDFLSDELSEDFSPSKDAAA